MVIKKKKVVEEVAERVVEGQVGVVKENVEIPKPIAAAAKKQPPVIEKEKVVVKKKETTLNTKTKSKDSVGEEGEKKTKKRKKIRQMSFSLYILKVHKQIVQTSDAPTVVDGKAKKFTMSTKAMSVMNSFVFDVCDKISREASTLSKKKKRKTLSTRDISTAVRLVLTGELAKHAVLQGLTAVNKYVDLQVA